MRKPTPKVWKPGTLLWLPFPTERIEAADWIFANIASSTSAPGKGRTAVASYTPFSSSFFLLILLFWLFFKRQTVVAVSQRTQGALVGSALGNTACSLTAGHNNSISSHLAACHVHDSETVGGDLLKEFQLVGLVLFFFIVVSRLSRTRRRCHHWGSWCRTGTTWRYWI